MMSAEQKRLMMNFFRSVFDDYNEKNIHKLDCHTVNDLLDILLEKIDKV